MVEAGDFHESENTVSELIKFLDSVYDGAVSDPDSERAENEAFEAISEIHRYICSPSLDQVGEFSHSSFLSFLVSYQPQPPLGCISLSVLGGEKKKCVEFFKLLLLHFSF